MELALDHQDRHEFENDRVNGEAKVEVVTVHQTFLIL
jgi:hypothetical protein